MSTFVSLAEAASAADEIETTGRDMARTFLLGDLMAAATKQLRSVDQPWLRLSEVRQKAVLAQVEADCESAISRAVDLIATDGRTAFVACVESVTFKDGVKAVLTMPNTMASHQLADTAGGTVYVVIDSPARYTIGADNKPAAEPDQRSL